MMVSEFLKEEGIKIKRVYVAFAKWDKKHDDFHIIPTPVVTLCKGELLKLIGVGIKWGFWGVGVGISTTRKDVRVTRRMDKK